MLPRYSHPEVDLLWSDPWTFDAWLHIECLVLKQQARLGIVPSELSEFGHTMATMRITEQDAADIRKIEGTRTHHEVAAFLEMLRQRVGEHGKWIHYGLTSSDLVDTAQGMRFHALQKTLAMALSDLTSDLKVWIFSKQPVLGMTHGQPAEPTSMGARAWHWLATLQPAITGLLSHVDYLRTAKLSGPVGTFAHNPPDLEEAVAKNLGLTPMGLGASQVVPRTALALWASSVQAFAAACNKIAIDLRLMNMLGEVRWPMAENQIGSSAMAHKNNPITAEQIGGFARMASGYAAMLQPVELWLERDISNSSVERVAVPDLWHVLFAVIRNTRKLLRNLLVDVDITEANLDEPLAWVHKMTLEAVADDAATIEEARESALIGATYNDTGGYEPAWFTRHIPGETK